MAVVKVPKPTIGKLPGYIAAVQKYKAPPAVVKAIAPTPAAKVALGPKFGSPLPAASQPIPSYMMPAAPVVNQTTPAATGGTVPVPRSAVPSNYQASLDEIFAHPLYGQALGQYNTNMQSLMRALQGNVGQAVIKSGYDPSAAFQKLLADRPDLGQFSDLLSKVDMTAAGANPLSERALNEQSYNRGLSNQAYELAARGIGGSGAEATGTNALLQNRQLSENQSRDALLNAITGGVTGYLGQQTQGYNALQDTAAQVASLLAQQQGAVYDENPQDPESTQGTNDVTDEENAAAVSGTGGLIPGTNVPSAKAAPASFINWGGQQIRNVTQMKQWLGAHGQSWNTWAAQHPDAARQLLDLS